MAERPTALAERPPAAAERAPLDDVMLAMDVVDTLRHRELMVERELASDDRHASLVARLKSLYAAQGLDVPDRVIEEGVAALEQNRFAYTPARTGFATTLARVYVARGRWGKPLLGVLAAGAVILAAWELLVVQPEARRLAALPAELETRYEAVIDDARVPTAEQQANALVAEGRSALARGEVDEARSALADLDTLQQRLDQAYELRIVSRPGELSGLWRVPEDAQNGRNYYVVVEAIDPRGRRLTLPIRSEEDGKTYSVDRWALRVDEATFERVRADKSDDGIIQMNVFGRKQPGYLEPEYLMQTTGGAITKW
jgi:hypothetical protein